MKKELKNSPIFIFSVICISVILWVLTFFTLYFFASRLFLFIIPLTLGSFIAWRTWKNVPWLSLIIFSITILIIILTIRSGFEEDYCFRKGSDLDPTGSRMIIATDDDAKKIKGFGVKAGQQIGVAFRAHMLCHRTFNVVSALQDKWGF